MIRVEKLTKKYGANEILSNTSLELQNGKIYGLIGRNGVGKTTLMKCVAGLKEIQSGSILNDDGPIEKKDFLEREIVYVSDEPNYYNDLTVEEHMWLICRLENYKKEEARRLIADFVDKLHMKEYLYYYPPALSKGTLQRMMLILGFLRKDRTVFLDEPFNGLDPLQLEMAKQICIEQKRERAILISSHDIESLGDICDAYYIFTADGLQLFSNKIDRDEVCRLIEDSYE